MSTEDLQQRSPEWFAARCGSVGASSIGDLTAKDRSGKGWGVSRANLMARLAVERLTGVPVETYVSPAMQHGTDTEAEARAAYSFRVDEDVTEVGLVRHPTIIGSHASPDGLVGIDGIVQIKCPQPAQHISTLLGDPIDGRYIKQIQWELCCTKRAWCDFISYSPSFPEAMRLHTVRVRRDDNLISDLEKQVREFLLELDKKLAQLTALYGKATLEAA